MKSPSHHSKVKVSSSGTRMWGTPALATKTSPSVSSTSLLSPSSWSRYFALPLRSRVYWSWGWTWFPL